jgi:hypothetical protein
MLGLVHSWTIRLARLFRDFDISKPASLFDGLIVTAIALDAAINKSTNANAMEKHFIIIDILLVAHVHLVLYTVWGFLAMKGIKVIQLNSADWTRRRSILPCGYENLRWEMKL